MHVGVNADIVAAVKTFTVRQLDREPQTVLAACDAAGAVMIRSRDGRTYTLRTNQVSRPMGPIPDFAARRRAQGMPHIPAEQVRRVDEWMAGE